MSDERVAALRYFLDLDNPYLGVDQARIREGIAALKSLESQNQALQEALRAIRDATGDYPNDRVAVLRQRLYEVERLARNALSPIQETDPE